MTKYFITNSLRWISYSALIYLFLIPCGIWVEAVSISLILGFLFSILNAINNELKEIKDKI